MAAPSDSWWCFLGEHWFDDKEVLLRLGDHWSCTHCWKPKKDRVIWAFAAGPKETELPPGCSRDARNWCFLGGHVLRGGAICMVADYWSCMNCFERKLETRRMFLSGEAGGAKRKADSDSDSESHPNPEPKKVVPLAEPAPVSSSSSAPIADPFEVIRKELVHLKRRQNEHWARMDYLSDRIDTTAIKSGDVAVRVAKCEKRLDDHKL